MDGLASTTFKYIWKNKMIDISIIIVNYNVKNYLEQLLYSIFNAIGNLKCEIIIVDNNSTDGSVEFLENNFADKIILIKNNENLGFGKANNQGLKIAKGEYVLLLNPDTIIEENTLLKMKEFMDNNPEAGACGCKILNPDGSLQLACRRGFPTPRHALFKLIGLSSLFPKSKFFSGYNLTYFDDDKIHEVDALSGSFMFIRKKILDKIGYFDQSYFMYAEDLDLCFRLKKISKIYYVPTTKIIHYKGESSKKLFWKSKIEFYKSMAIFVKKFYNSNLLLWSKPFIYCGIFLNALIAIIFSWFKKHFTQIIDFFVINISFLIAVFIRYGYLKELPPYNTWHSYLIIMLFNSLVYLITFNFFDIYKGKNKFFISKIVSASIFAFILHFIFIFLIRIIAFSRIVILLFNFITIILLIFWRLIYSHFKGLQIGYLSKKNVFLVGDIEKIGFYIDKIIKSPDLNYTISGIVSLKKEYIGISIKNINVIGSLENLDKLIDKYDVSEILTSAELVSFNTILGMVHNLNKKGIKIKIFSKNLDMLIGENPIEIVNDFSIYEVGYDNFINKINILIKKLFQIFFSFTIIIIFFIPFLYYRFFKNKFFKSKYIDKIIYKKYNSIMIEIINYTTNSITSFIIGNFKNFIHVIKGRLNLVGLSFNDIEEFGFLNLVPGIFSITDVLSHNLSKDEKISYYNYYILNQNLIFDIEIIYKFLKRRIKQ